jgi:hypothetical protein
MKYKGAVIGKSTPLAAEALLVPIEPLAKLFPSLGGSGLFALLALQSPVDFRPNDSANFKSLCRLLGLTVFAPKI